MTSATQTSPIALAVREHVLFVHAHPDDESITTGGTIALLRMRGAGVTLLTCTRGEAGEDIRVVLGGEAHTLNEVQFTQLRERELETASHALGVTDHRYLGDRTARLQGREPRRYRDTGMVWTAAGAGSPTLLPAGSLGAADLGEVAADIATVIADVEPTAVVSYDPYGGYGHPDHIRAHEAARHAAQVMGVPFFEIATPDDPSATLRIDVTEAAERKRDALTAYATQVKVDGDRLVHSNGASQPIAAVEAYRQDGVGLAHTSSGFPVWLTTVGVFVVGLLIGTLSVILHQQATFAPELVGSGVVIVLGLLAILMTGARLALPTRVPLFMLLFGVMIPVGILTFTAPGGSVMVPANDAGWALLFGPGLIAAVLFALPNTLFAPSPPRAGE